VPKETPKTVDAFEQKELKKQRQKLDNQVNKFEDLIASIEQEIETLNNKIYQSEFESTDEQNAIFLLLTEKQVALEQAMLSWEETLKQLEIL
jgi:hypothetical protein